MLVLLAIASVSAQAPAATHFAVQAKATIRIVSAASAADEWKSNATRHKREILIREPDGRTTRVRLVEHE